MEVDPGGLMKEAYQFMDAAHKKLSAANKNEEAQSRELFLSITKLEEAMLWFKQHGHRGRWTE